MKLRAGHSGTPMTATPRDGDASMGRDSEDTGEIIPKLKWQWRLRKWSSNTPVQWISIRRSGACALRMAGEECAYN
jgi:hypothetical protein